MGYTLGKAMLEGFAVLLVLSVVAFVLFILYAWFVFSLVRKLQRDKGVMPAFGAGLILLGLPLMVPVLSWRNGQETISQNLQEKAQKQAGIEASMTALCDTPDRELINATVPREAGLRELQLIHGTDWQAHNDDALFGALNRLENQEKIGVRAYLTTLPTRIDQQPSDDLLKNLQPGVRYAVRFSTHQLQRSEGTVQEDLMEAIDLQGGRVLATRKDYSCPNGSNGLGDIAWVSKVFNPTGKSTEVIRAETTTDSWQHRWDDEIIGKLEQIPETLPDAYRAISLVNTVNGGPGLRLADFHYGQHDADQELVLLTDDRSLHIAQHLQGFDHVVDAQVIGDQIVALYYERRRTMSTMLLFRRFDKRTGGTLQSSKVILPPEWSQAQVNYGGKPATSDGETWAFTLRVYRPSLQAPQTQTYNGDFQVPKSEDLDYYRLTLGLSGIRAGRL